MLSLEKTRLENLEEQLREELGRELTHVRILRFLPATWRA